VVPAVLLVAAFLVAGCGSQQASPLSVAKTEQVFAAAGTHLRSPGQGYSSTATSVHLFGTDERGVSPVAWLIGGSSGHPKAFVFVFQTIADAVRATRSPTNPYLTQTRVQNVVITAWHGEQHDPHLLGAIRHLKASG
jgi:hypothetical protein